MAEEKKVKSVAVHVAEVTRHEGPIVLPAKMSLDAAIDVLTRKKTYDAEKVVLQETVHVFPWDGALALSEALSEQFGFAMQQTVWGFFGPNPPQQIQIEIAPGETVSVPWGRFALPGITGWIQCSVDDSDPDGRVFFAMYAEVTHGSEPEIRKLMSRTREIATRASIYSGKAISVRFRDDDGDRIGIPTPKFLRLSDDPVIFTRRLEVAIETNILTPIRHADEMRKHKIPLKRGVLLAGVYGTGKTLTAKMIARDAELHGWTFIYVTAVEELAEALRFAQGYQPAIVFAEDVDRSAGSERTDQVNELLNTLDGIGNKASEIMVVLTSNHPESINAAMRRPGRIDIVLEVTPPDAEACERLVRHYARGRVDDTLDLMTVGQALEGQIPAVIREVVERSKLETIRRHGSLDMIEVDDLLRASDVLKAEQSLFKPKESDKHEPMDRFAKKLGSAIGGAIHATITEHDITNT